jgi:hypothetical protein
MADRTYSAKTLKIAAVFLWICGFWVGLVGGWAMLTVLPILGLAELIIWVWLARQSPKYVGLAGAVVGTGISWVALLGTSSATCVGTVPVQCNFSLAFGPSHAGNFATWNAETRDWMDYALIILVIGVILTIWAARRSRRAAAAAIADAAEAANPVWQAPTKPIVQTRPDSYGAAGVSGSTAASGSTAGPSASPRVEDPPA